MISIGLLVVLIGLMILIYDIKSRKRERERERNELWRCGVRIELKRQIVTNKRDEPKLFDDPDMYFSPRVFSL